MAGERLTNGSVNTSDGVGLHFLEAGGGEPFLILPGWMQTANEFRQLLEALSPRCHAIALDMRGHGESDKPDHGYRIARLAKDLADALAALDLRGVTLMGHSMGCAVIWSYLDLFGDDRVARFIFVDQMLVRVRLPGLSPEELAATGADVSADEALEQCETIAGPNGEALIRDYITEAMFTPAAPRELREWVVAESLKMPRNHAAALVRSLTFGDWRDTVAAIRKPTLAVGGRASQVDWRAAAWIAEQIPGAWLEVFDEANGGGHFTFLENPAKFHALVESFLDAHPV